MHSTDDLSPLEYILVGIKHKGTISNMGLRGPDHAPTPTQMFLHLEKILIFFDGGLFGVII
jgi:hypothetical protein